jgi:hypothetical protein|uniref:Uncharacterized protein n=1 Tax=Oryza sativa subsp. japonica TaxID=39947 RepID=Q6Z9V3_ORYSJ|nr:hypothetical protein [Oryza sativa Japonica Group]BAC99622.1 hypothetical protein [Oryza sativa Japonica Group]
MNPVGHSAVTVLKAICLLSVVFRQAKNSTEYCPDVMNFQDAESSIHGLSLLLANAFLFECIQYQLHLILILLVLDHSGLHFLREWKCLWSSFYQ